MTSRSFEEIEDDVDGVNNIEDHLDVLHLALFGSH